MFVLNTEYPTIQVANTLQLEMAEEGFLVGVNLQKDYEDKIEVAIDRCEKRVPYSTCVSWLTSLG